MLLNGMEKATCLQVQWGNVPSTLDRNATGNRTSYVGNYPDAIYVSGVFHHVKLEGLAPETTYFYRCVLPSCADDTYISALILYGLLDARKPCNICHVLWKLLSHSSVMPSA